MSAPSIVWCSLLAMPPSSDAFSTMVDSNPCLARSRAAFIPATPPPMTRALLLIGITFPCSGVRVAARATAARTRSLAFLVANSGLLACTHESWLRILAISNRYLFNPQASSVSINMGAWVLGLQEATTTRFSFSSPITSLIFSWVS